MSNELSVKVRMYRPVVGMTSCVWVPTEDYPVDFGNYCSLDGGPYLVNMWAENLQEWWRRNREVDKIEVTVISHNGTSLGVVTDGRLQDWCNESLCVTGIGWPSVLAIKKVGEITGLPIKGEFCGCEDDNEPPLISKRGFLGEVVKSCGMCGKSVTSKENES